MVTFRGFIAIDIPTHPTIQTLENDIKKTKANVKLVELQNIHITLKFLGDVDEKLTDQIETIIRTAVQGQQPFRIQLKHTGVFPNTNYIKVVWIGIEDNGILASIATKLEDHLVQLGFPTEKRSFSPHLTIGRVKTAEHKDQLLHIIEKYAAEDFGEFMVHSIYLKKSELTPQGPIYSTVKKVEL